MNNTQHTTHNTQHTTHNTQHTTHNTQHTLVDKLLLLQKELNFPDIFVKDPVVLENALKNHIRTVTTTNIEYTRLHRNIDKRDDDDKLENTVLQTLLFNMSNSDAIDFARYVNRRSDFIKDTTFEGGIETTQVGNFSLETYVDQLEVKYETPYGMNFSLIDNESGGSFRMPMIYYGMSEEYDEKMATIYGVQNVHAKFGANFPEDVKTFLNGVSTGVKENRNCPPKHVLVLAKFIKSVHDAGVRKITAPDFLPGRFDARFNRFGEIACEETQARLTEGFIRMFERVASQINGVDLVSYPGDGDWNVHLEMGEHLTTKNKLLQGLAGIAPEMTIDQDSKEMNI